MQHRQQSVDQCGVVVACAVVAWQVVDLCRGAGGFGDFFCRAAHAHQHVFSLFIADGADRAFQAHFGRDDVVAVAGFDPAYRNHRSRQQAQVRLAAGNGLPGEDGLGRDGDRINAGPGECGVGLATLDTGDEGIGCRRGAVAAQGEGASSAGSDMQAEDHSGCWMGQDTLFDHQLRTAFFAQRRTFFSGLEYQFEGAWQFTAMGRKYFGHAESHGHVRVMAAGMHHADFLATGAKVTALVLNAHGRGIRQAGLLDQRQGIHFGPDCHHRSRLAATQYADHAGMGDAGLHLKAQLTQPFGDAFAGVEFAIAQFRVLVNVMAKFDHAGQDAGDLCIQISPGSRFSGPDLARQQGQQQ
ncbi:hypothetical protein PCH70_27740 [Pseudomonas cichorii JBC1]|nr:hypothetical protein PCH70_27740 [Pseudomonas cichorii JBC1]